MSTSPKDTHALDTPDVLPLMKFPDEILLHIARMCTSSRDISALARLNLRLYGIANPCLYRIDAEENNRSALYWAAKHGRLETAQHSLDAGADVNAGAKSSGYPNATPIFEAAFAAVRVLEDGDVEFFEKYDEVVQLLANNGADINREIVENVTPLTVATLRGQPELVEYLFGLGATPPTRPGTAHTLISWHRREINVVYPILSSLLLHGLDANSRDTFGSTLLHVAAYTTPEDPRMEMVVKLLLTVGADVNAKNQDQETSLDLALGRSPVYAPVVHVLLEHGAQRGDGTSPTAEELGLPPKQAE